MSSYGHILMILAFCVGGGTAAIHRVHTGDAGWSLQVQVPLETTFLFNNFLKCTLYSEGDKHWTSRYQSRYQSIDGL